ncbi:MAG: heme-binding domain-containing protein [bacterium]|nr:heme-binding domain-containing protein [bacterium]
MVTSRENRFPRALLIAVGLVLAVVAGLWAKEETEPVAEGEEWENAVETPIEIASTTVAQKQDSLYANIDEQFKLVRPIFENACFDCHSTKTDFPWYAKIPGIKQLINGHVEEGLEHVDMTDGFPFKAKGEQIELLSELREEVEEGKMPLLSYRLMHWSAWLSSAEKDSIYMWVDSSIAMIEQFYQTEQIPYNKKGSEK